MTSALEIGCGSGLVLETLSSLGYQKLVGVEPSALAVREGMERNPQLDLRVGVAEDLPVQSDEIFDLIFFGGCLCWLDRRTIFATFQNAHLCLKEDGLLLLSDFYAETPKKVPYHHRPELALYTYKMDYARVLVASGEYRLLHEETVPYAADHPDRWGYQLLIKRSVFSG